MKLIFPNEKVILNYLNSVHPRTKDHKINEVAAKVFANRQLEPVRVKIKVLYLISEFPFKKPCIARMVLYKSLSRALIACAKHKSAL